MCDACEQQTCAFVLKEDISTLLSKINSVARDYEFYEYGLPLGVDGVDEEMRAAVYSFLEKYRPDIKTKAF